MHVTADRKPGHASPVKSTGSDESVSSSAVPAVPWYIADGWQPHPENAAYFFKGNDVKLEAELRAQRR